MRNSENSEAKVQLNDSSATPFDVDVTHVFSCDAGLIQSHIRRVPDDSTQEIPEQSSTANISSVSSDVSR